MIRRMASKLPNLFEVPGIIHIAASTWSEDDRDARRLENDLPHAKEGQSLDMGRDLAPCTNISTRCCVIDLCQVQGIVLLSA